jgi:hypothetical protein
MPVRSPAFTAAVTVTVLVAVASSHPPLPATVYVIVVLPAPTGVTTPVDAFMVATASSLLLHVPPAEVLLNVVVPFEQIACVPLNVPATGAAVTVTVLVAVSLLQPPLPATMYLIVVVPAATPVTSPEPSTVATDVFKLDQLPPASPSLVNVVVLPTQMLCSPLNSPASTAAVTVTVLVAVALSHPPLPATVYVIVTAPVPIGVTTPVDVFIVALSGFPLVHEPPETLLLNVVVPFEQIACVPLNVPATGAAVTVTVLVAVSLLQPPLPATMYLIVVVPAATPVTSPEPSTVATDVLTLDQLPPASPSLAKVVVPPTHIF